MTILDIFWVILYTAMLFVGSLMLAAFPFMVVYAIILFLNNEFNHSYTENKNIFLKTLDNITAWIEENPTTFLLILALIIFCADYAYNDYIVNG